MFTSDFAALRPDTRDEQMVTHPLMRAHTEAGTCRVLCFSPRHDLTMARMSVQRSRQVVDMWADRIVELSGRYRWAQVFENRGAGMGASNPHPHGQLWGGHGPAGRGRW